MIVVTVGLLLMFAGFLLSVILQGVNETAANILLMAGLIGGSIVVVVGRIYIDRKRRRQKQHTPWEKQYGKHATRTVRSENGRSVDTTRINLGGPMTDELQKTVDQVFASFPSIFGTQNNAAGPPVGDDVMQEEVTRQKLRRIKQMLDEGLITREEYEEQKEALLLELLLKRRGAVIECPRCGARVKAASGKNALQRGYCGTTILL